MNLKHLLLFKTDIRLQIFTSICVPVPMENKSQFDNDSTMEYRLDGNDKQNNENPPPINQQIETNTANDEKMESTNQEMRNDTQNKGECVRKRHDMGNKLSKDSALEGQNEMRCTNTDKGSVSQDQLDVNGEKERKVTQITQNSSTTTDENVEAAIAIQGTPTSLGDLTDVELGLLSLTDRENFDGAVIGCNLCEDGKFEFFQWNIVFN